MDDYFVKNQAVFSTEDMKILKGCKVLVAGCGGLGGSVIELLARSGIGHLVLVDGDVFETSNMNRQILCTTETLGKSKAEAAAERVRVIDPEICAQAVNEYLNEDNCDGLIRDCDIVIDALDSIEARLMLEDACERAGLFLIHGAVQGFSLQIGVCPPGKGMLHLLYGSNVTGKGSGGIAMAVFICASFEVSEAIKILLDRPDSKAGKILFFDLLDKESQEVTL